MQCAVRVNGLIQGVEYAMLQNLSGRTRSMVLMRIGKREHLQSIRTEGLLYMNTRKFFNDLEHRAQQESIISCVRLGNSP
jgi:hypothetical protein